MATTDKPVDYAWSVPGGLVERLGEIPGQPELWGYSDRFSYARGETVSLRVHTTEELYDVEILRDGAHPVAVFSVKGLAGRTQATPTNAYASGCGWEESIAIKLGEGFEPGFHLVILRTCTTDGALLEREAFFIIRPDGPADADILLIHATSTLLAYNDWGGGNHYRGLPDGHRNDTPSPLSATQRPIARGMLRKPVGSARNAHTDETLPLGWVPRHPTYEWACVNGYSRHHADAGWATYERPFTVWAEQQGYRVGHITQTDLHEDPEILKGHPCAVIVGHDEYWSWEMRDNLESYLDSGGNLARFAGNYFWQVRLDSDSGVQSCYKDPGSDPMLEHDITRVTTAWDWEKTGRPGATTMGLTGLGGAYIRYGSAAPRASGGFTVYRPEHWALEGSDLYYGDVFGEAPICIAAFEVDGVDYTMRKGLPFATGVDGAPDNLEIIAMAPAVLGCTDRWNGQIPLGAPINEVGDLLEQLYPDGIPEHKRDNDYGAAMIASYERGAGTVFCAGTTDWVYGLIHRDPFTEKITRNVIDRFLGRGIDCSVSQAVQHSTENLEPK